MKFAALGFALFLTGCGSAYISPSVSDQSADVAVRIVPLTAETVLQANRGAYRPKQLPSVFFQTGASVPTRASADPSSSAALAYRIPPEPAATPYTIGVGDVVLLATRSAGTTVEELTGLLAAQNRRQGYTVQDDGAIAVPELGRVVIAGSTLEQAESIVFQKLVENQIDPTFSIEVAEFNSKRVTVGGAVTNPTVVPIRLTPLYLEEVLAAAGGITAPDPNFVSVRIYRGGTLYQIPLTELYSSRQMQKIPLMSGDSIFVDSAYDLNQARDNYRAQVEFDAVDFDYVYLIGEVSKPGRMKLPLGRRATLADAIYGDSTGIPTQTGNVSEIYVLRASADPKAFGAVTAWHLNAANPINSILATRMELHPNDIVFVAEQPVTKWNRVVAQIGPSLITSGAAAATD